MRKRRVWIDGEVEWSGGFEVRVGCYCDIGEEGGFLRIVSKLGWWKDDLGCEVSLCRVLDWVWATAHRS